MRLALWSLSRGGAPIDLRDDSPFPRVTARSLFDHLLQIDSSHLTAEECDALRPRALEVLAGRADHPTLHKIHDAWTLTPRGEPLLPPAVTRGAVYVVRDPRDVAVSFAAFMSRSIDRTIEFMANADASLAGSPQPLNMHFRQRLTSWSQHVDGWLAAPVPTLLIRYEDMLADPRAVLERSALFLGWTVSAAELDGAVATTRFSVLQAQEQAHGFHENVRTSDRFFRRGVAGGWRDTLSTAQAGRIERDHAATMARLGYLPFR